MSSRRSSPTQKGITCSNLQPTFFPLELYGRECGNRVLHAWSDGPAYSSRPYGKIPYLDVCATKDDRGRLSIGVVNRDKDRTHRVDFELAAIAPRPSGQIFTIDGPSVDAMNSFDKPEVVAVSSREDNGFGARFSYEVPAHSISLLQISP